MKKILLTLTFFLLLSIPSHAAGFVGSFTGYCQKTNITVGGSDSSIPNCTVTVTNAYTGALATLNADGAGTVLANPFTVTGTRFTFFVADGTYNLALQGVVNGTTVSWGYNGVIINSGSAGGGISSVAVLPATCTPGVTANVQLSVASPGFPKGLYGCAGSPAPANTWFFIGPSTNASTFTLKSYGFSPNDYGAYGDYRTCFDGQVTGQPTATFTSLTTATITNTALTSNVATYTATGANVGVGELVTVTGSTNGAGTFNITNQPITTVTSTAFTVAITHADVGSAADIGTATASCAAFVASDATAPAKVIEIMGAGAAGGLLSTTIATFVSPSVVTLAANATTNVANTKWWYTHNDDTPVQAWQSDINNGFPNVNGLQIHSGYLAGIYGITKPVRLTEGYAYSPILGSCSGPAGGSKGTTNGWGTPEPFDLHNSTESLYLTGNGNYRSGFAALSNFNWSFPSASVNNAVLYVSCWNQPTVQLLAVFVPDPSIAFNTAANTGNVCGVTFDINGHELMSGLEIANFHNTTGSLAGHCVNASFEGAFEKSQMYANDINGWYGRNASGYGTDWLTFSKMSWTGARTSIGQGGNVIFDALGAGTYSRGVTIAESKIDDCDGNVNSTSGGLTFRPNVSMADVGAEFQITNTNICQSSATAFGGLLALGGTVKIALTNVHLHANNAANTTWTSIYNGGTATSINVYGGELTCAAVCSTIALINTGSTIKFYGTKNNTGATTYSGTAGAAGVFAMFDGGASTVSGTGSIRSTLNLSDQGTAQTSGNVALTSGWSTSSVGTVSGFTLFERWIVTVAGTPAASPVITVTFPTAFPSAPVCQYEQEGGTFGVVTNPAITTNTTTATLTFSGTPVAAQTYTMSLICGL